MPTYYLNTLLIEECTSAITNLTLLYGLASFPTGKLIYNQCDIVIVLHNIDTFQSMLANEPNTIGGIRGIY